jgi:hypothetical protein
LPAGSVVLPTVNAKGIWALTGTSWAWADATPIPAIRANAAIIEGIFLLMVLLL